MKFQKSIIATLVLSASSAVMAQEPQIEEVVVTGIRASLQSAIEEKRNATNLVEVIQAVDIGKLPDQNLAEVLENITGVQITRTAGVGTGVQIRGTNDNRTEINGVSTTGSGTSLTGNGSFGSRSGNFEDISSAIISSVEITKAAEAKTIEGSVGGTINLKTIRPLDIKDRVASIRIQGEDSSLADDVSPRFSGAWGDNWETSFGSFGVVLSGSYTEQNASSFRPRVDRDNSVLSDSGSASAQDFNFLGIQFLVQENENFEFETQNFAGTFEWAPNDNVKLYFDAILTDQERTQDSYRIQASGISGLLGTAIPSEFETVNFGSLPGSSGSQDLGSIQAAVRGVIPIDGDGSDGNLRFSSDTGARVTETEIFRFGGDWQINDRLSSRIEVSTTSSDTASPNFSTTLNFINPNSPLDAAQLLANHQLNALNGNEDLFDSNENGTPFEFDLTGGSLAFGLPQGDATSPTSAQLLDPANVVLRDVNQSANEAETGEDAFRVDFTYDLDTSGDATLDFGYRRSRATAIRNQFTSNVGLREFADSPTGDLFADLLVAGPSNFDSADGRDLFIQDFLLINPDLAFSDPNGVLATLNDAIVANNLITGSDRGPLNSPTSQSGAFFDIEEETDAFYIQSNFESGIFRGNIGLRYISTDVTSSANSNLNGVVTPNSVNSSYDFLLPRMNLTINLAEDFVVRTGWGSDIQRPPFDALSSSVVFQTSPNQSVNLGNPGLNPEEVDSFDLSAEWYFAPGSFASIGVFNKRRTGVFFASSESPVEDPITGFRDLTDPCEGGGVFNPIADVNVFGPNGVGVCVPSAQTINGEGETTQRGLELAVQYDLQDFESELGWASGFGILANYTLQEFSGGDSFQDASSRASTIFANTSTGATDVDFRFPLLDFSENSYNITLFYEKYGVSARARYTWREAHRTADTAAGASANSTFGFPTVTEDRGQLNASINYAVTEKLGIGLEAVNLTESDIEQSCVNEGGLFCFQGLPDRRVTFGLNYNF